MTDDRIETAEKEASFYEERWFQGTVAVVGLVSAIWALGGLPRPWDMISDLFAAEAAALSHTEIVLDTSAAMNEQFEGDETKFDAAVRAIGQAGGRDDEGLALRGTEPGCGSDDELLVDFGTGNTDEVLETAEEQQPAGESNIVNAVIEAVADFRNEREFKGPRSTRRVLVFTSGQDECFEGDVAGKIKAELEEAAVSASFTLIALKASGEDLQQLEELKNALESTDAYVETRTPDSSEELEETVGDIKQESGEAIKEGEEEKEVEETISG
jgi:hypothetical protein